MLQTIQNIFLTQFIYQYQPNIYYSLILVIQLKNEFDSYGQRPRSRTSDVPMTKSPRQRLVLPTHHRPLTPAPLVLHPTYLQLLIEAAEGSLMFDDMLQPGAPEELCVPKYTAEKHCQMRFAMNVPIGTFKKSLIPKFSFQRSHCSYLTFKIIILHKYYS